VLLQAKELPADGRSFNYADQ